MNIEGAIFMAISWGTILFLLIFTFSKILREDSKNKKENNKEQ
jgi:hypothetical protein